MKRVIMLLLLIVAGVVAAQDHSVRKLYVRELHGNGRDTIVVHDSVSFLKQIRVYEGIRFADGTIQITAGGAGGDTTGMLRRIDTLWIVTEDELAGYATVGHNHSGIYLSVADTAGTLKRVDTLWIVTEDELAGYATVGHTHTGFVAYGDTSLAWFLTRTKLDPLMALKLAYGDTSLAWFVTRATLNGLLSGYSLSTHTHTGIYQSADADLDDLADGTLSGSKVQTFGASNAGVVGASGGGTTNYLRADGMWAEPPGGSGMPGSAFDDSLQAQTKIYYVTKYGATTADADQHTVFQNAIDAASVSGGIVMIPPGTWRLDSTLVMASGVTLKGAGSGATVLNFRNYASTNRAIQGGGALNGVHTRIAAAVSAGDTTIALVDASGIVVGDIIGLVGGQWRDTYAAKGEGVEVVRIAGNTIYLRAPIFDSYNNTSDSVIVYANRADNVAYHDFAIERDSQWAAARPGIAALYSKGITVQNVRFRYCTGFGVELESARNVVVDGCDISDTYYTSGGIYYGYGVSVGGACQNVRIANNHIQRFRHPISLWGNASGSGIPRIVSIVGNTCDQGNSPGVNVGGIDAHFPAEHVSIVGNTVRVYSADGAGIEYNAYYGTISGNTIWSRGKGIMIAPDSACNSFSTVTGNTVHLTAGSDDYGVYVSGASDVTISGNMVANDDNTAAVGVGVAAKANEQLDGVTITGNTVDGCIVSVGLWGVSNSNISNNILSNPSSSVIKLYASGTTVCDRITIQGNHLFDRAANIGTGIATDGGSHTNIHQFFNSFDPTWGGATQSAVTNTAIEGGLVIAGNIAGATYGSDGSVSNAELLYINTLSSNAQTQISARVEKATFPVTIGVAGSDETTALTASTSVAKVTIRAPYAFTLTAVRASVTTAPTGAPILVDVHESGTTVLSTKCMIDATEKTSTTAATAYVISDAAIADDAELTFYVDQIGSTIAGAGIKIWLIGTRSL
jgi:hypothetical protein